MRLAQTGIYCRLIAVVVYSKSNFFSPEVEEAGSDHLCERKSPQLEEQAECTAAKAHYNYGWIDIPEINSRKGFLLR